jgi:hypothetical protein
VLRTKKDFEPARLGVFATLGSPLTPLLNCGIPVKKPGNLCDTDISREMAEERKKG